MKFWIDPGEVWDLGEKGEIVLVPETLWYCTYCQGANIEGVECCHCGAPRTKQAPLFMLRNFGPSTSALKAFTGF